MTYLCARNLSIISGPVTPSGKPGKFSTCPNQYCASPHRCIAQSGTGDSDSHPLSW